MVSIDYSDLHILIQVWFGGSIFVSRPQGAGAALCVLCAANDSLCVYCLLFTRPVPVPDLRAAPRAGDGSDVTARGLGARFL